MPPLGPQTVLSLQLRPEGLSVTRLDLTALCWAPIGRGLQAQGIDAVHFNVPVSGGGPGPWLPQVWREADFQPCFLLTQSPSLSGFFLSQDLSDVDRCNTCLPPVLYLWSSWCPKKEREKCPRIA